MLAQVPHFDGCIRFGASARAVFGKKSSLHFGHGQSSGKVQLQMLQQDGLVVGGSGHATFTDRRAAASRQHDIDQFDPRQFIKHPSRFIAQPSSMATLGQGAPQHIGQEANHDVCLDTFFLLVPDRTDLQVRLVNAKGCFGRSQLRVRFA